MNEEIAGLTPECVWRVFAAICNIPHPSGEEGGLREYLRHTAESAGLHCRADESGNLMIEKPASLGWSGCRTVILQSHLDMVPQVCAGYDFNFSVDVIPATVKDGWVVSEHTTLGADNGIGVALAMAALLSHDFNHVPIKAIFTVEEEVGLHGAFSLPPEWVSYPHMMINLDSEELDKLYVGCAGGSRANFSFVPEWEPPPPDQFTLQITLSGLLGGHSGADIHLPRGNAIKLLAEFFRKAEPFRPRISSINGGSRDNAIPRDASAVCVVPGSKRNELLNFASEYEAELKAQFDGKEPNLKIEVVCHPAVRRIFSPDFQKRLLEAISTCRHGVIEMSGTIPGMVGTSSNLAILSTAPDEIRICTSQRSENDEHRDNLTASLASHFEQYGAVTHIGGKYPGWAPQPDSHLVQIFQEGARKVLGRELEITAIHAGLECGVIGALNRNLEMVSFGPTMENVHAPGERVNIESVRKCWDILRYVLGHA